MFRFRFPLRMFCPDENSISDFVDNGLVFGPIFLFKNYRLLIAVHTAKEIIIPVLPGEQYNNLWPQDRQFLLEYLEFNL